MRRVCRRAGFTITELLVVVVALTFLLAALLPSIARAQSSSGVQQSISNLVTLGVSHVLYALDWDGRQVTWVKDDLGVYDGDPEQYNYATEGCNAWPLPEECQDWLVAGRG
jgi:type II secretory pathway pseudopilin PulG